MYEKKELETFLRLLLHHLYNWRGVQVLAQLIALGSLGAS